MSVFLSWIVSSVQHLSTTTWQSATPLQQQYQLDGYQVLMTHYTKHVNRTSISMDQFQQPYWRVCLSVCWIIPHSVMFQLHMWRQLVNNWVWPIKQLILWSTIYTIGTRWKASSSELTTRFILLCISTSMSCCDIYSCLESLRVVSTQAVYVVPRSNIEIHSSTSNSLRRTMSSHQAWSSIHLLYST